MGWESNGPPGPPGSVGPVTQIAVSTIFHIGWSVRIAKQKIFSFVNGLSIFFVKTTNVLTVEIRNSILEKSFYNDVDNVMLHMIFF